MFELLECHSTRIKRSTLNSFTSLAGNSGNMRMITQMLLVRMQCVQCLWQKPQILLIYFLKPKTLRVKS